MSKYSWILNKYPTAITKEQFYRICHVSKKTARYYILSGLIPCRIHYTRKTHRYEIMPADVVAFLIDRDANPEKYKIPSELKEANAITFESEE